MDEEQIRRRPAGRALEYMMFKDEEEDMDADSVPPDNLILFPDFEKLKEEVEKFGLRYIVERSVRPYDTATLNYNWQVWDTMAFSLYTDTTESISNTGAGQAVLAVMNFMAQNGIIKYSAIGEKEIRTIDDKDFISVRTAKSGFFEALVSAGEKVQAGKPLANILNPYEGEIIETLYAPLDGIVFFIHNAPLTYANTAVIKLLANE